MSDSKRGRFHPKNDLNDLTGREWLQLTRTWFVADSSRYHKNKDVELHPARYPEEMVERFVRFFTKSGGWVLDPFLGSGATLITCHETDRNGVGIEVSPDYARLAANRLAAMLPTTQTVVIQGDSRRAGEADLWAEAVAAGCPTGADGLPLFDFSIGSPPYGNMLRTSRGGVVSAQQERALKGLDTVYSESPDDLGNIADHDTFVEAVGQLYDGLLPRLRPGRYLVVVAQNYRAPDGLVRPLAWDLARRLSQTWQFCGEQIWCQDKKRLGIWGYPRVFVPNYHHHYCLVFRRPPGG